MQEQPFSVAVLYLDSNSSKRVGTAEMYELREGSVTKLSTFLTSAQYGTPWILGKMQENSDFIWLTSAFSSFEKSINWWYLKQTPHKSLSFIQFVTK